MFNKRLGESKEISHENEIYVCCDIRFKIRIIEDVVIIVRFLLRNAKS